MKKIVTMSLMMLAAGLLELPWMPQEAEAAGPDYPMMCRGGGTMHADIFNAKWASIDIYFSKAKRGASQSPPGPGECTWLDRPISANEPSMLYLEQRLSGGGDNPVQWIVISSSGTRVSFFDGDRRLPLLRAIQQGQIFHVRARREGRGLRITRLGP